MNKMKAHQTSIGISDEWFTPPEIIYSFGRFDLDPASNKQSPFKTADVVYDIEDDGLSKEWFGRVWLNPPFNRYQRPVWMERMALHGNGIMLVPAACETDAFFKWVYPFADSILFLKGRPHFYYKNGDRAKANSGCTICLVAYGSQNTASIEKTRLGKLIKLTTPGK